MPEPTDQLSITLSIIEWNTILQILGKEPFNVIAPVMNKIAAQGNRQSGPMGMGNGAEAEEPLRSPG